MYHHRQQGFVAQHDSGASARGVTWLDGILSGCAVRCGLWGVLAQPCADVSGLYVLCRRRYITDVLWALEIVVDVLAMIVKFVGE